MEKIDLKKKFKHLYQPSTKEVDVVIVPAMNYLMIDGVGDPNTSQAFSEAVEVLFSLSYTLKFMVKKGAMAYCRWKACGGRMICPRLVLVTNPVGNGH